MRGQNPNTRGSLREHGVCYSCQGVFSDETDRLVGKEQKQERRSFPPTDFTITIRTNTTPTDTSTNHARTRPASPVPRQLDGSRSNSDILTIQKWREYTRKFTLPPAADRVNTTPFHPPQTEARRRGTQATRSRARQNSVARRRLDCCFVPSGDRRKKRRRKTPKRALSPSLPHLPRAHGLEHRHPPPEEPDTGRAAHLVPRGHEPVRTEGLTHHMTRNHITQRHRTQQREVRQRVRQKATTAAWAHAPTRKRAENPTSTPP